MSKNYKVSSISAGGLEISILLTFSAELKRIHEMMEDFVGNLYDYNYCVRKANNDQTDDDSDNKIIVSVEWETFEHCRVKI